MVIKTTNETCNKYNQCASINEKLFQKAQGQFWFLQRIFAHSQIDLHVIGRCML